MPSRSGIDGRARCWLCRAHERCSSLRSAGFGCGRLPGLGADCGHTGRRRTQRHRHPRHRDVFVGGGSGDLCDPDGGYSSNLGHDDRWLGDRFRRGRRIHKRGHRWSLRQPIEHDIVLSRCFRRVFRKCLDGTLERRSGMGVVPALRSIGNAALPSRDRSVLRPLIQFQAGES
jgi:hypothetical protein